MSSSDREIKRRKNGEDGDQNAMHDIVNVGPQTQAILSSNLDSDGFLPVHDSFLVKVIDTPFPGKPQIALVSQTHREILYFDPKSWLLNFPSLEAILNNQTFRILRFEICPKYESSVATVCLAMMRQGAPNQSPAKIMALLNSFSHDATRKADKHAFKLLVKRELFRIKETGPKRTNMVVSDANGGIIVQPVRKLPVPQLPPQIIYDEILAKRILSGAQKNNARLVNTIARDKVELAAKRLSFGQLLRDSAEYVAQVLSKTSALTIRFENAAHDIYDSDDDVTMMASHSKWKRQQKALAVMSQKLLLDAFSKLDTLVLKGPSLGTIDIVRWLNSLFGHPECKVRCIHLDFRHAHDFLDNDEFEEDELLKAFTKTIGQNKSIEEVFMKGERATADEWLDGLIKRPDNMLRVFHVNNGRSGDMTDTDHILRILQQNKNSLVDIQLISTYSFDEALQAYYDAFLANPENDSKRFVLALGDE